MAMKRRRMLMANIPENTREASAEEDDDNNGERTISIANFPSHILMDILSRLSVKNIFRCRSACKMWYNLLLNPLFAKLHFTRAPTCPLLRNPNGKCIRKNLYLIELERDSTCDLGRNSCNIKKCYRYFGDDTCDGHVNMKLSTKFSLPKLGQAEVKSGKGNRYLDRDFDVVNSCNGLLCLCGSEVNDPIVIYNPVVGEYVSLPKPEEDKNATNVMVCGLGFCAKTNQYKVLRMVSLRGEELRVAEIHTLGSGLWRRVGNVPRGNVPFLLRHTALPTFLNGALHWFTYDFNSIVSFNFEDEQFRAITWSYFNSITSDFGVISKISIGVLKGCLCICDSSDYDSIDIWVMKDYGIKESWTKEFQIDIRVGERWPAGLYQPIDFLTNGNLLMFQANNALISYDGSEFKYFKIHKYRSRFQAIAHIPSFVSLKDVMGDNVEVLNVRSRFANAEPQKRTAKALFLVVLELSYYYLFLARKS